MLDYSKSFIEEQFPVSKISKESYKERKAGQGQTLTGLGKWWGRKPLILVRATILGSLMPVSDDKKKDREIFLKILTMDEEGLHLRLSKNISKKKMWKLLNEEDRKKYFSEDSTEKKPKYPTGMDKDEKEKLKEEAVKKVFEKLSYDEKLRYLDRPEHVNVTDKNYWKEINEHLQTNAHSLEELVKELGQKRFGRNPKIGDCFAGGGSIPYEAGRIGGDVFASDLNPVAGLLTWSSLNILGSSDEEIEKLKEFRQKVYDRVDSQIKDWGIEYNEKGHRADSYLYCVETTCPECGYTVPLAPSWTISKKDKVVGVLKENIEKKNFDIEIITNADKETLKKAESLETVKKGSLDCPHCKMQTPISSVRGDTKVDGKSKNGLKLWDKDKFVNDEKDIFKERLYGIRYIDEKGNRYFTQPSKKDIENEEKIVRLLKERFADWQEKGYIPSSKIKEGEKTDEPIRTRGWQYWHQLFNPRQLLTNGLFAKYVDEMAENKEEYAMGLLGVNKLSDWNSRLSIWHKGSAAGQNTFMNQALNTLFNYATRGISQINSSWFFNLNNQAIKSKNNVLLKDARVIDTENDIWITDPPYADAVNYHQLTEFFLAWDKKLIKKAFPDWYNESKRILAVKGTGQSFNESMIDIYKNLAKNMPDNGMQVVMFTHQDVKVWSELAMILWAAGLKVSSAWNISTETESGGLKSGNYVKGTVLLALRKQTSDEMAFQDELYLEIKKEVKDIIDSMKDINDKDDPDFNDADYLLASYAASLKVITSYKKIDGIDLSYWLSQSRNKNEENPVEQLIKKAVKVAYDYLIPKDIDKTIWKDLTPEERFFIRSLELEMNKENKIASFQELARGFGVKEYGDMFSSLKANNVKLKTPSDYGMKYLNKEGFASSTLRHVLVSIYETSKTKSTVEGKAYLKTAYQKNNEYWYKKPLILELLNFISKIENVDGMDHWQEHACSAKILKEAIKNEGV